MESWPDMDNIMARNPTAIRLGNLHLDSLGNLDTPRLFKVLANWTKAQLASLQPEIALCCFWRLNSMAVCTLDLPR